MVSVLVLYSTGEGQTEKIAHRLTEVFGEREHDATAVNIEEHPSEVAIDDFDAVIVGASIHRGTQQPAAIDYFREHRESLASKPTAFFQVSLASATEEGAIKAAEYVEAFLNETGWHPDRIGLFGGALRYSQYGFLTRLVVKQIVKRNYPEVATDHDVELTEWDEVDAFAADFAAFIEGRVEVTPEDAEN
jgi:menaquinone-dependent protoporphyrinogen oxidase